jgi:phage terminase small subunit
MALTAKQQRFVEFYLEGFTITESYKKAGYSANTDAVAAVEGSKLLKNPKIQEEIGKRRKVVSDKTDLNWEWVLRGLKADAEYDGEGSSHSARVRAKELIGKHLGMFADKVKLEHSGPDGQPIQNDIQLTTTRKIDQLAAGLDRVADRQAEGGSDSPGDDPGEPVDT